VRTSLKLYRPKFERPCLSLLLVFLLLSFGLSADESRPAYLDIKQQSIGVLHVNWTRPVLNDRALNIRPVFPTSCESKEIISAYQLQGLIHERWILECEGPELSGKQIEISGLSNTISDVLIRSQRLEGKVQLKVLNNKNPIFIFTAATPSLTSVAFDYFKLGVLHIKGGNDHLLFVLGLLLLIQGFWNIIKTITTFTLAHSLSLALAVLGYVQVPSAPVEALIALSIMFLACELVRVDMQSLSRRFPWLVAAVFGLVHGLGFAGGLEEIGLPPGDIPLALLMFNIGVEAGQILFVLFALILLEILNKFFTVWFDKIKFVTSYAMGSIAALWLIERVSRFY
jgi:hypothetical protein